mmetsp:Transcript_26902/g.37137  ORF Transcript_26902/g.37137 Transcript_26902/m.37137 type:complete len:212 (-) Transcript_26902:913-1548(-)
MHPGALLRNSRRSRLRVAPSWCWRSRESTSHRHRPHHPQQVRWCDQPGQKLVLQCWPPWECRSLRKPTPQALPRLLLLTVRRQETVDLVTFAGHFLQAAPPPLPTPRPPRPHPQDPWSQWGRGPCNPPLPTPSSKASAGSPAQELDVPRHVPLHSSLRVLKRCPLWSWPSQSMRLEQTSRMAKLSCQAKGQWVRMRVSWKVTMCQTQSARL